MVRCFSGSGPGLICLLIDQSDSKKVGALGTPSPDHPVSSTPRLGGIWTTRYSFPNGMGEQIYAATQGSPSTASNRLNISSLLNRLSLSSNPFQEVPSSSAVILLTPYLHVPPPHIQDSAQPMDPFEPFGRDLSEYHSNIRHVPYVPKYGMVDVHKELLSQAGAVIVVICKPPSMKASGERLDGSKYQKKFARDVGRYIKKLQVPTVLVTIGMAGVEESERYGDTLELDGWDDLDEAASRIYGCG